MKRDIEFFTRIFAHDSLSLNRWDIWVGLNRSAYV